MNEFNESRSESIRAALVSHVAATNSHRRRGLWAAVLVLSGGAIGAGVTAGAFAATAERPVTTQARSVADSSKAIPAPDGVSPGTDVISLLGKPISVPVESTRTIALEARPEGATHVRVTVTGLAAGTLSWGVSAESDAHSSATWTAEDLTPGHNNDAFEDYALDDGIDAIHLRSSRGFKGIVTAQYVNKIPTRLGVNASGQTYGIMDSSQGDPDLVRVGYHREGDFTGPGYAMAEELNAFSPDHRTGPSDPKEALRIQKERDEKYPNGWDIPVYKSDGKTRIGTLRVGGR